MPSYNYQHHQINKWEGASQCSKNIFITILPKLSQAKDKEF